MCEYTQYFFACGCVASRAFRTAPCCTYRRGNHTLNREQAAVKEYCRGCRIERKGAAKEAKLKAHAKKLAELERSQESREKEVKARTKQESLGPSSAAEPFQPSPFRSQLSRRGTISLSLAQLMGEKTQRTTKEAEIIWYPESVQFRNTGFQNLTPFLKSNLRSGKNRSCGPSLDEEPLSPKSPSSKPARN